MDIFHYRLVQEKLLSNLSLEAVYRTTVCSPLSTLWKVLVPLCLRKINIVKSIYDIKEVNRRHELSIDAIGMGLHVSVDPNNKWLPEEDSERPCSQNALYFLSERA